MWSIESWKSFPIQQNVHYEDQKALIRVLAELSNCPPLVTVNEIERLNQQLTNVSQGKSFLLQGGDCAESFAECNGENISNKFKVMLEMSLILLHGLHKPILKVGRMAGQYAKPRSKNLETKNDITLPCYRGDLINQSTFTKEARTPTPSRMLDGYHHAAATLNYLRALTNDGSSNLKATKSWVLSQTQNYPQTHQMTLTAIENSLKFVDAFGGLNENRLTNIDNFFNSHEALHLPYESALTREVNGKWYNLSTHFPWLGIRTADLNSAHIEYLRGIENPVAIKIGPEATTSYIQSLVNLLNPQNKTGKLMLITRLGTKNIHDILPDLIKSVQDTGNAVIWSCDPMHGNTQSTTNGFKTRDMNDIMDELKQTIDHHNKHNSLLGGVHLELTGENVTECIGGIQNLNENDLDRAFKSLVDPRLNYEQSLEVAFELSQTMQRI